MSIAVPNTRIGGDFEAKLLVPGNRVGKGKQREVVVEGDKMTGVNMRMSTTFVSKLATACPFLSTCSTGPDVEYASFSSAFN